MSSILLHSIGEPSEEEAFPRVLVVGPAFGEQSGAGLTISNLFRGWPRAKLANLQYFEASSDDSVCCIRRTVSRQELGLPFMPVCLRGRAHPVQSAAQCSTGAVKEESMQPNAGPTPGALTSVFRSAAIHLGLGQLLRVRVTSEHTAWVKAFQPEVIYNLVYTLTEIELVHSVARITGVPVVTHICDDFVTPSCREGNPFLRLLRRYTAWRLAKLIAHSAVCMSIGKEMSRVYLARYGREFLPFASCPDAAYWVQNGKSSWVAGKPFRFLIVGQVYAHGNQTSLVKIAEAIQACNDAGACMALEVHTSLSAVERLQPLVSHLPAVTLSSGSSNAQSVVAALYRQADALLLTVDAFESFASSIHLSIPTRLPICLLSATPLVLYSPSDSALARCAKDSHAMHFLDTALDRAMLMAELQAFASDEVRRQELGLHARKFARDNLTGEVVRPLFRAAIGKACQQ